MLPGVLCAVAVALPALAEEDPNVAKYGIDITDQFDENRNITKAKIEALPGYSANGELTIVVTPEPDGNTWQEGYGAGAIECLKKYEGSNKKKYDDYPADIPLPNGATSSEDIVVTKKFSQLAELIAGSPKAIAANDQDEGLNINLWASGGNHPTTFKAYYKAPAVGAWAAPDGATEIDFTGEGGWGYTAGADFTLDKTAKKYTGVTATGKGLGLTAYYNGSQDWSQYETVTVVFGEEHKGNITLGYDKEPQESSEEATSATHTLKMANNVNADGTPNKAKQLYFCNKGTEATFTILGIYLMKPAEVTDTKLQVDWTFAPAKLVVTGGTPYSEIAKAGVKQTNVDADNKKKITYEYKIKNDDNTWSAIDAEEGKFAVPNAKTTVTLQVVAKANGAKNKEDEALEDSDPVELTFTVKVPLTMTWEILDADLTVAGGSGFDATKHKTAAVADPAGCTFTYQYWDNSQSKNVTIDENFKFPAALLESDLKFKVGCSAAPPAGDEDHAGAYMEKTFTIKRTGTVTDGKIDITDWFLKTVTKCTGDELADVASAEGNSFSFKAATKTFTFIDGWKWDGNAQIDLAAGHDWSEYGSLRIEASALGGDVAADQYPAYKCVVVLNDWGKKQGNDFNVPTKTNEIILGTTAGTASPLNSFVLYGEKGTELTIDKVYLEEHKTYGEAVEIKPNFNNEVTAAQFAGLNDWDVVRFSYDVKYWDPNETQAEFADGYKSPCSVRQMAAADDPYRDGTYPKAVVSFPASKLKTNTLDVPYVTLKEVIGTGGGIQFEAHEAKPEGKAHFTAELTKIEVISSKSDFAAVAPAITNRFHIVWAPTLGESQKVETKDNVDFATLATAALKTGETGGSIAYQYYDMQDDEWKEIDSANYATILKTIGAGEFDVRAVCPGTTTMGFAEPVKVGFKVVAAGAGALKTVNANASPVVSVEYYGLDGVANAQPVKGLNVVVVTRADGSKETSKVLVK